MLTGHAAANGPASNRSASPHPQRRSAYPYYDMLTQLSGGFVVQVNDKGNISQAIEVVKVRVCVAQVGTLLSCPQVGSTRVFGFVGRQGVFP